MHRFEFDSGGPDAFGPWGRWTVACDAAGTVALTHHRGADHRQFAPVTLSAPDHAKLWDLIAALDVPHLQSSTRPPVPDEGAYTFRLQSEQGSTEARIWRHDALKNPSIAALVSELARLIQQTTAVTPVLG